MGTHAAPLPKVLAAPRWRTLVATLAGSALFGFLYLAAASLGMMLADPRTEITPVWPAAGLSVAALLRFGWRRLGAALTVSAVLEAAMHSGNGGAFSMFGAGLGNALGPIVGAILVERFAGGAHFLLRPGLFFGFVLLGAAGSALVSSVLGVAGGVLGGVFTRADALWTVWFDWCAADLVSVLLIVPPLIAWSDGQGAQGVRSRPRWRWLEAALLALACAVGAQIAFGGWPFVGIDHPLAYLTLPLLIWAAFRFPVRGITAVNAGVAGLAITNTVLGYGQFAAAAALPGGASLTSLQVFLGFTSIMALGAAAVVNEGRAQAAALEDAVIRRTGEIRAAHGELEARVQERTAELARVNESLRREVAERARAEAAAQGSEARLHLALEAGHMSAWRIDLEGDRFSWFHHVAEGKRPAGAFPDTLDEFSECVHPDDRPRTLAAFAECRTAAHRVVTLYRYRSPGQPRERWVETSGLPIFDASGNVESLVGVSADVTERIRAERAMRVSEEKHRLLFDLNPLPTWVFDHHTLSFLAVNQAAVERYGYTREEFLAMTIADVRLPEDVPALRATLLAQGQTVGKTSIWRHRKKSGELIHVAITAEALLFNGRPARLVVAEDVTERTRAEEAVRASESRLRLALEAGRMSVWRIDLATDRVDWSAVSPVRTSPGWSPDAFPPNLGEFARDVHPEDRERVLDALRRCKTSGEPINEQYRFLRRHDGATRWIESRCRATRDARGQVDGITGLSLDITRRKAQEDLLRARAEQQRTVSLLGQSALAGLNLDALLREAAELVAGTLGVDGSAVWAHQPGHGTFLLRAAHGFPVHWIGQPLTSDGPGTGARHALQGPIIMVDVATETRFQPAAFLRELGFTSAMGVVITGEEDGRVYGTLGAYSRPRREFKEDDVTFLQAVANVLAAAIERKRALEAIQLAREEAERANAAKSEFLSRMSHELRTPLNAILGFGQLLEIADLAGPHQQSVEYILRAGRHLLGLIDEILDIARIESGQLALNSQAIDAPALIAETLTLLRPMAAERSVRLGAAAAVDDGGGADGAGTDCRHVLADGQRLKQILLNLISNAIKFNRPGGEVRVTCRPAPADRGRVRLEVRDTGHGISAADQTRLFTPFERLNAGRDGIEGTGIGLALSQRLAESMQGAITVESEPGVGSTFAVELPRAEGAMSTGTAPPPPGDAAPADQPGEPPADAGEGATGQNPVPGPIVLYIEDNLPNLKLIERIFERWAHTGRDLRLLGAMQGGLGLDLARQHRPAVILLDLQLPDMTGEEVLNRLQADERLRAIPVLVLSADVTPRQIERLLAAGATGYVTKPLDLPKFLALLDSTLAQAAAPRAVG